MYSSSGSLGSGSKDRAPFWSFELFVANDGIDMAMTSWAADSTKRVVLSDMQRVQYMV